MLGSFCIGTSEFASMGIIQLYSADLGYGLTLVALVILSSFGTNTWDFVACLFAVGAAMMAAIPTIQVRMTHFAPEAPTLMGAMNLAALNVANALGAWGGGLVIATGYSVLFSPLAGFVLTAAGLFVYFVALPRRAATTIPA
jgi:DHA1 family inner membrane transport protein